MRVRKIIPTKRIWTVTPNGEMIPSYGEYKSIAASEKLEFQLATKQAIVEDVSDRRNCQSFERLVKSYHNHRASERIF